MNPWDFDAETFAEIESRVVKADPMGVGPEVQLVPFGSALEALVGVFREIDAERSAFVPFGAMHWARATAFVAPRRCGSEVK